MRNRIEERHRQPGHQKVTFSGERQIRSQPTMLKETGRRCACLKLVTGWRQEKKNLCWEFELSAGTTPTQPVWHKKTSSREFKFKCFQIESVPMWLSQVNTNPEIPSGRTRLESRLTTPQTCHQLHNALRFQGGESRGGVGEGGKCVHLEFLKCSIYFLKKNKMMLYMDLGHSSGVY